MKLESIFLIARDFWIGYQNTIIRLDRNKVLCDNQKKEE